MTTITMLARRMTAFPNHGFMATPYRFHDFTQSTAEPLIRLRLRDLKPASHLTDRPPSVYAPDARPDGLFLRGFRLPCNGALSYRLESVTARELSASRQISRAT